MIGDQDYFDLPKDPELAFLELERKFREKLENRLDGGYDESPFFEWYQVDRLNRQVVWESQGEGKRESEPAASRRAEED